MREIKFRAWDKKNNRMFQNVSTGTLVVFGDNHEKADWEDCAFMQYTGLKDKNGKEIYEGDIVCHKNNKEVIKYELINPILTDECTGDIIGFLMPSFTPNCEIIGNIYEDKELLTAK